MPIFNFRATSGYVTDDSGETYVLNDAHPTTRDTHTFGYVSTSGVTTRNRNSGETRFAGEHFVSNNGTQLIFVYNSGNGTFDVNLASGPQVSTSNVFCEIVALDSSNAVQSVLATVGSGGALNIAEFNDATGVTRSSISDWESNNATKQVVLAGSSVRIGFRVGSSSADTLTTHLVTAQIEAVASGPTLSLPTEASIAQTTATIGCTSDDATGTLYAYTSTSATAPSAVDLKAGTGSVYFDNDPTPAASTNTFSATGLTAATTYYNYFIHTDGSANDSNILESGSWITLEAVASLSSPTPSGTLATDITATLGATTDVTVGTFYGVVDSAANLVGVTDAQVKLGQNKNSAAAVGADSNTVTTTSPTADITGLTAATLYSYAIIQTTTGGDSTQETGTFTTAATLTPPTVTGPASFVDGVAGTTTGTNLDTIAATGDLALICTTGGATFRRTLTYGTRAATTVSDTDFESGESILRASGSTPLAGIPLAPDITALGITNYVVELEADDQVSPADANTITSDAAAGLQVVQTMITEANTTATESMFSSDIMGTSVEDNHQLVIPTAQDGVTLNIDAAGEVIVDSAELTSAGGSVEFIATYLSPSTEQWSVKRSVTLSAAGIGVPVLSDATETAITQITATIGCTTNDASGTLWAYSSTSATAPNATDLKAGTGSVYSSSKGSLSVGANTFSATGFIAETTYYNYFIQNDGTGDSTILESGSWITEVVSPVLSLPTVASITDTTVTVGCTTDVGTGDIYYYISTSASAPNSADLKAGTGSVKFGTTATPGTGIETWAVTGLTLSTTYYSYFIQEDTNTNDSNILESGSWATAAAAPPVLSLPTEASITQTTATIGCTSDVATGTLYSYVSASATPPNAADLKAGTGAVYSASDASVNVGTNTFAATGLTDNTTYYSYFIQNDGAADSNILESGSWATIAAVVAVISVPLGSALGDTAALGGATSDSTFGTLYGYVSQSATPPSAADNKSGSGSDSFNTRTSVSAGTNAIVFSGLAASTAYYIHYIQNNSGGDSNQVSSAQFTTDAAGTGGRSILSSPLKSPLISPLSGAVSS